MDNNYIPTDEQLAKRKKYKEIWDKVTTGILVLVFCLPVAILAYILLWFVLK